MTRTLTPSKLFVHKVLLSLQFLQGLNKDKDGATARKITSYIRRNFPNDGDIASQVQASLDECLHYGFVEKAKHKYILVGPIASIQMHPHNSQYRVREVERIRKIFPYDWKHSKRKLHTKQRRCPRTDNLITSFFRKIKNWLCGSVSSCKELQLPKQVHCRRFKNMRNLKRMKRRRHCSRSGCTAPYESHSDRNRSISIAGSEYAALKKTKGKLCDEAAKLLESCTSKSRYKQPKRRKRTASTEAYSCCDCVTSVNTIDCT
ncbi:hypothetical protein QE152_g20758 [Popillia japonica]|uniref:H15 domain-containing protein n=1 Tax=Popillia japonica TaxID=7064 RepID=A0AAW1KPU2_POPJA